MESLAFLGALPARGLLPWLLAEGMQRGLPWMNAVLADPTGSLTRFGSLLFWEGAQGKTLLAGLESVRETQDRVATAVENVESLQLGLGASVAGLQTVSCLALGVTSLTSAAMLWQLNSLGKRVNALKQQIADVQTVLDAIAKAPLKESLIALQDWERRGTPDRLADAQRLAVQATSIFGPMTMAEIQAQKRLPVLNVRGRLFIVALTTEIRARLHQDDLEGAKERLTHEEPILKALANASFEQVMTPAPAVLGRFLAPSYQQAGIDLNLLTEVYRLAGLAGIDVAAFADANATFEHVRQSVFARGPFFGSPPARSVVDLRYLLTALEDVTRVMSLQQMIKYVEEKQFKLADILAKLEEWRREKFMTSPGGEPGVFAYSFA